MDDFLSVFEPYRDIKEVADLIEEIKKLRNCYYTQNYVEMQQHVHNLTLKYLGESMIWNSTHTAPVYTYDEQFSIAEEFLYRKGIEILIKQNIKTV